MIKVLLSLAALAATALAVEPVKLPLDVGTLTTRDGKVLEGAKIVGQDAVGVKVMHAGGTARIPYARLPKELADRFPRDPAAAREQLEKEARHEAAHDRSVEKAVAKDAKEDPDDEETTTDTPLAGEPKLEGDAKQKIAALEDYIRRLQVGIEKARKTATAARERAGRYRAAAVTEVVRSDGHGGTISRSVTNSSRISRAEFQEARAAREEGKAGQAEVLISEARAKISELSVPAGK